MAAEAAASEAAQQRAAADAAAAQAREAARSAEAAHREETEDLRQRLVQPRSARSPLTACLLLCVLCPACRSPIDTEASGRPEAGVCSGSNQLCLMHQRNHSLSAAQMVPTYSLQEQQAADAASVTALMSEQSAALQQRAISLERERDVAESTAQACSFGRHGQLEVKCRSGRSVLHVKDKGHFMLPQMRDVDGLTCPCAHCHVLSGACNTLQRYRVG